jgi:hypothetical protein
MTKDEIKLLEDLKYIQENDNTNTKTIQEAIDYIMTIADKEPQVCPLCGSGVGKVSNSPSEHFIECPNPDCNLRGPKAKTEAVAISLWNALAKRSWQGDD